MIVPSFYGTFADSANIQAYLDRTQDMLYGRSIWRNLLDEGIPQASLTFETAIGRSRIEAAASVVDPDAPAPLRSRSGLESLNGKIPTMKEKFRLNQADMRALMAIQENGRFNDNARVQALLKSLYDDVSKAAVAGDKRVDIMLLQGLSTLLIDTSATLNPDGAAYGTVPLLARAYQRQGVPIVWSNAAGSFPITDIETFINAVRAATGRSFSKILMSLEQWLVFKKSAQVIDMVKSYYNIGKTNGTYAATIDAVNEMFTANRWPMIEIIDYSAGIESDGIISTIRPFSTTSVVFVPDGKLGVLQNAYSMEVARPVPGKSYANFGPTLVGKWMEQEPLSEFTAMEMNAFPALTDIDGIYVLKTETVLASYAFTDTSYIVS
jgi:hypothetical protein